MKKLKTEVLVKFLVVFLVLAGFLISGKMIYDNLLRATKINLSLVETYRPHLDVSLVKKAAGVLQEKSDRFKETSVSPKEEVEIKEEKKSSEEAVLEESKEASPEAETES
jgi:enoyl reductase-like protein